MATARPVPKYKTHKQMTYYLDASKLEGTLGDIISYLTSQAAVYGEDAGLTINCESSHEYYNTGNLSSHLAYWVPFTEEELAARKAIEEKYAAEAKVRSERGKRAAAKAKATKEAKKKDEVAAYIKAHPELLEELKD